MPQKSTSQNIWEERVFLTDNPFRISPPGPGEKIVWAGMAGLKSELEDLIRTSLQTSPSRLVLNWGDWGGGKTHAARYFSRKQNLRPLCKEAGVGLPLPLNVTLPRGVSNVVQNLYKDILSKIRFKVLQKYLHKIYADIGPREANELFGILTGSEDFGKILLKVARGKDDASLLDRYLNMNAGTPDLRALGVPRAIEGVGNILQILGAIFNLLTYKGPKLEQPLFSEIFLWIDENEEITSLPGREQSAYEYFLRDIVDTVPNNLTVFMNFTLKTPFRVEDIGIILGDAVWERIANYVYFEEFKNKSEMKIYLEELLNHEVYRPSNLKEMCPDVYYPFKEEVLNYIFEKIPRRTPRRINAVCGSAIELALAHNRIKSKDDFITLEFIKENKERLLPERPTSPE